MESIQTSELIRAVVTVVLGAIGTWLLMPQRLDPLKPAHVRRIGAAISFLGAIALASIWNDPGGFPAGFFLYAFGIAAVVCAILTITSRNPVHSALWFAAVVLATSGLFLLSGAQFLAAGTIIVYAGAIIVTFLFVIMLAQMEGRAVYDRAARAPARATFSCYLLFWALIQAILMVQSPLGYRAGVDAPEKRLVRGSDLADFFQIPATNPTRTAHRRMLTATNQLPEAKGGQASGRHVASLGGTLYTDHLITVELVGVLLFVALIGAISIATPKTPKRPAAMNPTTSS